ncbi:hypothetical protein EYC84_002839 [Monilinia fructicola]|uniref:Uncharacterized protein n=1 Tax=Monilinia fructicola TaxID=38448 RepID=A0A5M9JRB1_MONFR|nr:hypothetical protein EYC84_002839 [Monilinia fructicola]
MSGKVSTPPQAALDIGPAHHPPSLYGKSSDIESINTYDPGSSVKSPLTPPMESPPYSASSMVANDSSAQTEDEVVKERNEAIRRTSDLREQLEMETARSAILKKERDDAILCALAMELRELAIKLGEVSAGDKLGLAQFERDHAITREVESAAQNNKAEEARDKALELSSELGSQIKQLLRELHEAHKLVSRTLSQKEKVEKERDEAREGILERLEDLKRMAERHVKEKEKKKKPLGFLGAVGTIINTSNWE